MCLCLCLCKDNDNDNDIGIARCFRQLFCESTTGTSSLLLPWPLLCASESLSQDVDDTTTTTTTTTSHESHKHTQTQHTHTHCQQRRHTTPLYTHIGFPPLWGQNDASDPTAGGHFLHVEIPCHTNTWSLSQKWQNMVLTIVCDHSMLHCTTTCITWTY